MDNGELDRLGELFTDDVIYDVSAFGLGELRGREAIRRAALELGEKNPLGHHVTNVVVIGMVNADVQVISKGLGVRSDGTCGTVTYHDLVRSTPAGWRIAQRRVVPRRSPLTP